jgi:uncharacterized RDD family membrane protein YckC
MARDRGAEGPPPEPLSEESRPGLLRWLLIGLIFESGRRCQASLPLVGKAVGATTGLLWWGARPLFFWTLAGQTPGKALIGLRVVQTNGELLRAGRAFGGVLGYWLASLPFFLGFLWILVDDQRRGWHDHLTNTCVIYAWEARKAKRLQARLARRLRAPASNTRGD